MSRNYHVALRGREGYSSYLFFASALGGASSQRRVPAALYLQVRTSGIRWIGSWERLRASLDTEARGKILCRGPNSGPAVERHYANCCCEDILYYYVLFV
jgi:hypothetical protein